jgi:hypothetical protein
MSITSSEPDNSNGDGHTSNDIRNADIGTDDREFRLRAERRGPGVERIYLVTYEADDGCGNTTQAQEDVRVPHDQSGRAKTWSGFTADGRALDQEATNWWLLIPSTPDFDAIGINPDEAYVGNYLGIQVPITSMSVDHDDDGLLDLLLAYDAEQTRALQSLSNTAIGLHYQGADSTDYSILNIFRLGAPLVVPQVPTTPETDNNNATSDAAHPVDVSFGN